MIGLTFLGILLFISSVFMMMLILVQRGKGGGLTGALGGMGGQSAFGSKAGDVFTKITVITAIIWITLCMLTIAIYNPPPRNSLNDKPASSMSPAAEDAEGASAGAAGAGGMGAASDEGAGITAEAGTGEAPADIEEELSNLLTDEEAVDAGSDSTSEPALEGSGDADEDSGDGN